MSKSASIPASSAKANPEDGPDQPVDERAFRDAMAELPCGVTVLTADDGAMAHAMTASSFTSVSLDPLLVLICVKQDARLTPILRRAGRFGVHILAEDQKALAELCAGGPAEERIAQLERRAEGAPRLPSWLARFECRLHAEHTGGDHAVFLGAVEEIAGATPAPDAAAPAPLLWWRGRLRRFRSEP